MKSFSSSIADDSNSELTGFKCDEKGARNADKCYFKVFN